MRTLKMLFAAGATVAVTIASLTNPVTTTRMSAQAAGAAASQAKRYRATRPLVAGGPSGAVRMPTQQEIDQTIGSLSALAQTASDSLTRTSVSGAVALDLAGGYAGVMLARPNDDGTWETRCVFSLEEGVAFLGLVADSRQ
jgi:hypothetical protein